MDCGFWLKALWLRPYAPQGVRGSITIIIHTLHSYVRMWGCKLVLLLTKDIPTRVEVLCYRMKMFIDYIILYTQKNKRQIREEMYKERTSMYRDFFQKTRSIHNL